MEVMELAVLRKAFAPSKNRFVHPHAEALRLKKLWTFERRHNKSKDAKRIDCLLIEAKKYMKSHRDHSRALSLISQGLSINPRCHSLYALRAEIFFTQDKLDKALKNYEDARRMMQFDTKLTTRERTNYYNERLIDTYRKRGLQSYDNGRLLEALSDFEEILVLKPYGLLLTEIQDKLLDTLRILDKYEAYRYEWNRFMKDADPLRVSSLLTQRAEYKIFRREMASARHTLFEAIDLDAKNTRARELLQIVYDTGHHLIGFAIIWAVYGCYDKALITIEKSRDCDPYNPGYTLLKAIVLRLSGRLLEAGKWLESVDKGFYKLLEPSRDKEGSIMGNLTIGQTRTQLVKQWHLIRYDIAVKFMLEERYEDAMSILKNSKLRQHYAETYLLMGDCMLNLGEIDAALRMYLDCLRKSKELKSWPSDSQKNVGLLRRITNILNNKCNRAIENRQAREAIKIAEEALRLMDEEQGIDVAKLGQSRSEALICKARAHFQKETLWKNNVCTQAAGEGLQLTRRADNSGLYKVLFNDMTTENIVHDFGTRKKLPQSLKMLMQYS